MCRYSSMGREYTRASFLSVNATSAWDPEVHCQNAQLVKSNDGVLLPFRSTTCARTTLPALLPHSTFATRSFARSARHRAHFAPTMRSRHRTRSSWVFGDGLYSRATERWALSALHGAPVCASSTNVPEFRGCGTPSTSDGEEEIDHTPLPPRTSV